VKSVTRTPIELSQRAPDGATASREAQTNGSLGEVDDTMLRSLARAAQRLSMRRPEISVELCVLLTCMFFAVISSAPFWKALLADRRWADASTWTFAAPVFIAITLLHFAVLAAVCNRWTAKPILAVLLLVNACAMPFMQDYGVYLDPTMVRNIVRTDVGEAGEYLSVTGLMRVALYGGVPAAVLLTLRFSRRPLARAAVVRCVLIAGAVLGSLLALALVMKDFAPLMRAHKQMRYLITPGNYLYSMTRVLTGTIRGEAPARTHLVGTDRHTASAAIADKPVLFVMIVGETARGDNFSLNGYARDTNPRLSNLDIVNFPDVTSCGTATEVSLPCMFSPFGRDRYDEDTTRNHDGLLNVLAHAGYRVLWRDNNSGCKGTCEGDGIALQTASQLSSVECPSGRCLDEVLLRNLNVVASTGAENVFLVLHQLGNHGPAYYQRYPPTFRRFTPTCDTVELRKCTQEQLVNTYDNAILYTDHLLGEVIAFLSERADQYRTAMLYVGDHGESLGEGGVYLHGLPYAIAPHVQTHVPMLMWMSESFREDFKVNSQCIRAQATRAASHDNVFHSIVGLLAIETSEYRADSDLFESCVRHALRAAGRT
jgi:lipid A ethanolaminephosphotransferase